MKKLLTIVFAGLLHSCSSTEELKTVQKVDIPKFMGTWYVIANIPTFIEKGAHNAIEKYSWNEKEDRIDVDFTFNKDGFDGEKKSYPQKGFIYNKMTNAEWRIQPFWPLKFTYLVMDLAPDYSWTVIGVPNRSYVWIMARNSKMDENLYSELVQKIKAQGFDIKLLEKVPQQ